jgi:hypothetical protein
MNNMVFENGANKVVSRPITEYQKRNSPLLNLDQVKGVANG